MQSSDADVLESCRADKAKRLYGVELEMEVISRHSDETEEFLLNKFSKDVIIKDDGSLGGARYATYFNGKETVRERMYYEGMEMVTRPMTYLNHLNFWRKFNKAIKDFKWRESMISHFGRRCGVHIHVSRDSIPTETAIRMLLFANNRENEALLKKVCQRYHSSWAEIRTISPDVRSVPLIGRYSMIAPRSYTYEWRMFRGTLKLERLLSYLQFTRTVIDFCGRIEDRSQLTSSKYIEWLNATKYNKELKYYINRKQGE